MLGVGAAVAGIGVDDDVVQRVGGGRRRRGCSGGPRRRTSSARAQLELGEGFSVVESNNVWLWMASHGEVELTDGNGGRRRGKPGSRVSGDPGPLFIG